MRKLTDLETRQLAAREAAKLAFYKANAAAHDKRDAARQSLDRKLHAMLDKAEKEFDDTMRVIKEMK